MYLGYLKFLHNYSLLLHENVRLQLYTITLLNYNQI